MKKFLWMSAVALLALTPSIAVAMPQTLILLNSQPGDYIGQGLQQTFTPADGTLTASALANGGVQVSFHNSDFSQFWFLNFGPPSPQKIVASWGTDFAGPDKAFLFAGSYLNAQRYPFQPAGIPGMDIAGAGRGCNTLTGNFTVTQTPALLNGKVLHFGADFEQHCEGFAPALFGSIRINCVGCAVEVRTGGQKTEARKAGN